jgi:hypothetical protein
MTLQLRQEGSIALPACMLLLIMLSYHQASVCFSPEIARRVPGIWKLQIESLPIWEPDIRSQLQGLLSNGNAKSCCDSEILLKLNPDGTFKQCNEGYVEGKWISGNWKLIMSDDMNQNNGNNTVRSKLILAFNRQYYGPQFDLVLEGCLQGENHKHGGIMGEECPQESHLALTRQPLSLQGSVRKGKYLHPRGHTSFFDPPFLASPETIGPFHMQQSFSSYSILGNWPKSNDDFDSDSTTSTHKIHESDFHDRRFILTTEPLKQSRLQQQQMRDQPVDIRSMPITFFSNNTFTATCNNKILRGRFHVRCTKYGNEHELSMEISLFGAGRSAPGSVYSEGMGLTHEDQRSYVGTIQQREILDTNDIGRTRRFYVHGTVFFGTDLGEDARPEPVAMFYLIEDTTSGKRNHDDKDALSQAETTMTCPTLIPEESLNEQ